MVTYAPGPPTRAFESLVLLTQLCGGAFPIQGWRRLVRQFLAQLEEAKAKNSLDFAIII